MPLDYVRVKDKATGHHYTVLAQEAEANPDAYDVLKQDAVNANGDPLPGEIPSAKKSTKPLSSSTNEGQSATATTKEK